VIEADKYRLSQVISNLLGNAVNFTKRAGGTSIWVSMENGERRQLYKNKNNDTNIVVSIKDTGTGVDLGIMPKLFTKFATASRKGTGLGLYISQSIIEAHGGRIWAQNKKDGKIGAVLSFSLPTTNTRSLVR
jgi:signal transduction histidine kinase